MNLVVMETLALEEVPTDAAVTLAELVVCDGTEEDEVLVEDGPTEVVLIIVELLVVGGGNDGTAEDEGCARVVLKAETGAEAGVKRDRSLDAHAT